MIDPNFWDSEDIAKLTPRQRLLWIGLWSNADDEGRGRGSLAAIRSTVFKYDDLTLAELADDLEAVRRSCKVVFYEVAGSSYYACLEWDKWQKVDHPKPSFLPAPPATDAFANDSREIRETFAPNLIKSNLIESADAALWDYLQHNIPTLATVHANREMIKDYMQQLGSDLVLEACKRAVLAGVRKMAYVKSICETWIDANVKTLQDVAALDQLHEARKQSAHARPSSETPYIYGNDALAGFPKDDAS